MFTLADAWVHSLDPVVIPISGSLAVRWYGLAYLAGFVGGWLMLRWMSGRGLLALTKPQVTDFLLAMILGVLVGGRLGYVLVYEPSLLAEFSSSPPWWGLFAINKGGMASHGGIAGVIVATLWFARRVGVPWLHVLDSTALTAPIGLFFGRLANFVNGELLGKIVAAPGEPGPRWSVRYPQELLTKHAPELTAAQERQLVDLITPYQMPGERSYGPAVERMIQSLERGGATAKELARELPAVLSARHPSQLYQALAEGLILFAALWIVWARPRKPGVIGCWFMIVYGVGRIITEFWRLPDDQFVTPRIAGLSRGQWLSVAMVIVGVAALPFVSRRKVEKFGGWLRPKAETKNATA
jgi:phosphatidylglycerol:prolipoprotein diacylglycerol transferase